MQELKPKDILTRDLLIEEYIINKLSEQEIAKKYNIKSSNSVRQKIGKYGLYRPSKKLKFNEITKEWLYEKYVVEDLSALSIAQLFGSNRKASILKLLHEFKIPIRQTTRSKKLHIASMEKRICGEMPGRYFCAIKGSADKRKLEFSITPEYIWNLFLKQDRKCAISDEFISFHICGNKSTTQTASLDRIDSSKGYVEGNVQWLHKDINKMKWDLQQDFFIKMCKKVAKKWK